MNHPCIRVASKLVFLVNGLWEWMDLCSLSSLVFYSGDLVRVLSVN